MLHIVLPKFWMGCEHQPENSNAIGLISLASITVDFLNFSAFSLKEKSTHWVVDVWGTNCRWQGRCSWVSCGSLVKDAPVDAGAPMTVNNLGALLSDSVMPST